jgi:hypothetical protein
MRAPTAQIDRFWASDWSLTTLLAVLCLTIFVLRPLQTLGYDVRLLASLVFSVILISGIFAVSHSPRLRIVFATVAVISILVRWLRFAILGPDWMIAEACGAVVAFGMLATIVLVQVFREGPVTIQRIQGAVAAYLIIALIFATGYTVIDLWTPGAFSTAPSSGSEHDDPVQRFLYFSFVTLTTTGYGDIAPIAPAARSLAMFESLIGQLFPSILLARLVSLELYYRQRRFEREQAELDRQALANEVARLLKKGDS